MNDERRYDDAEVDRIFQLAAEAPEAEHRRMDSSAGASGMTLRELQEIGEEVGISRRLVARAASALDTSGGPARRRRTLGLPLGVERSAELARPLTDLEWERLVALLRRTFRARGNVEIIGRVRHWSNGNLQVSVEPTASGYELRLQTHKGSLRPVLAMASSFVLMAVVLMVLGVLTGEVDMLVAMILAVTGVGVGAANLGALPSWAGRRARQMDEIAEAVMDWTALPASDE